MAAGFSPGPWRERPEAPWRGYKLAYPMVSADGRHAGFTGVALGRSQPYGLVAEAVCAQGLRHRCPSRWCDCGFYCFHRRDDARAMACDAGYRDCVLLEVQASGRYVRYEKGLRYAHQRVTAVSVGRCDCGRGAELLVESGGGIVGWRQLVPACAVCTGARPAIALGQFAVLAGEVPVRSEEPAAGTPVTDDELVPLLSAEVAVLHARLDHLQAQLDRLTQGR